MSWSPRFPKCKLFIYFFKYTHVFPTSTIMHWYLIFNLFEAESFHSNISKSLFFPEMQEINYLTVSDLQRMSSWTTQLHFSTIYLTVHVCQYGNKIKILNYVLPIKEMLLENQEEWLYFILNVQIHKIFLHCILYWCQI